MVGSAVIWIGLLATLVSAVKYYQAAGGKSTSVELARRSFRVSALSVGLASFLLLLFIMRHQFEYSYVWSYSSRSLPTYLLVTAFWAGQEGSFLLWALFGAVIGLVLLSYARRKGIEFEVMSVYALLQVFLLLLVAVKSPFDLVWNAHPDQFHVGHIPPDGKGLNPLLQNFWMAIHPPVLFLGFAALAVPFVFAVAALWKRIYSEWISLALPWVLFGSIALGAGIMLGGYWAYGVLGWGGWWGWDPVENSSLIPWIVSVILIHTMVVQKKKGKLTRTNLALAMVSFTLVIYSTFLTRSGILGESSVHSFVDPGALAYTLLLLWLGTVAVIGGRLLQQRWKELEPAAQDDRLFNRQSFIGIAAIVMGLSTLVIFFGTSLPIVSKTTVEPAFYNSSNLPLAIVMCLFLGFSLLLRWDESPLQDFLKRLWLPLLGSLVVSGMVFFFGLRDSSMVLLSFSSLFVFFVNLDRGYRIIMESPRYVGGAVAHIGLALLFLGIIGSGHYGEKETASLVKGEAKEVLGYQMTYERSELTEKGKNKFVVKAEREGQTITLEPVMFQSSYNNSIMRNPDYVSFLTRDFYIEPVSVEQEGSDSHKQDFFRLEKGVPTKIGDMEVRFIRFDMGVHGTEQMMTGGGMSIGAVLEVKRGSKTEQIVAVTTYAEGKQSGSKTVMLKDGKTGFQLTNMNIDMQSKKSTIDILVFGLSEEAITAQTKEMLVIEASVKPFINLVWVGTVFLLGGLFIAMLARRKETGSININAANEKSRRKTNRGVSTVKEPVVQEPTKVPEEIKQ